MRRIAAVTLVLAVSATALAGRRDVNRDGRVDMEDVRALARMVAGLDPADPDCDQDGDGLLTMADVNALLAALDRAPARATPTPRPAAAAPSRPGAQFLVVEQAADGRVVVVVGAAGVRPGDRILGTYGSLAEAEAARRAVAGGGQPPAVASAAPPTPRPAVRATPTPAVPPAPAVPELAGAATAVPLVPGKALVIAPGWREGWLLQVIGDGTRANLRRQDLGHLARWYGRCAAPAAVFHAPRRCEAILVFVPELGEGRLFRGLWRRSLTESRVAFARTITGRSRSVLVLPRQGNDGRTAGLYLYHWPTGTALYSPGVTSGSRRAAAREVPGFPPAGHEPLVVPVEASNGATRSFALLDPAAGTVWLVLDVRPHPFEPRLAPTAVQLGSLGAPDTPLALTAAALREPDGSARAVLVVANIVIFMTILKQLTCYKISNHFLFIFWK